MLRYILFHVSGKEEPNVYYGIFMFMFAHYYLSTNTNIVSNKVEISVPPSDASDTDDHDSVHSLPVGSTRKKVSAPTHSVSSGHTPQASYADIARHAAALYTQQAGQQQHAVYREQLQFR